MNLVVNAHPDALPGLSAPGSTPALAAIALRVRDAAFAYRHALDLGAWEMPTRASAMELNIRESTASATALSTSSTVTGISRSTTSISCRWRIPIPGHPRSPACTTSAWCKHPRRPHRDWLDFYRSLFGFSVLPQGQYFGVLPRGTLLESPCRKFYLQLIEPPPGSEEIHWDEALVRLGLGARDAPAATRACRNAASRSWTAAGAAQPKAR